jgi:hypothetical protein
VDGRPVRSVVFGAVVAVAALLASAGAAAAAVTKTRITTPATDPTFVTYAGSATPTLAVSGTSDGGELPIDLRCDAGTSTMLVQSIVPSPSGIWDYGLTEQTLAKIAGRTCVLRAVRHGRAPTSVASFAGIRVAVASSRVSAVAGGPNTGALDDFSYTATQLLGRATLTSAGSCGLAGSGVYTPNVFAATSSIFDCDAHFPDNLRGRSAVLVDGHSAYLPAGAAALFANAANGAGFSPVAYSVSLDQATGNVAIQESDALVVCAPRPAAVPSPATCSSYTSAGVRLDRRIVQQGDGRVTLVFDTWVSTDGRSHVLNLFYENHIKGPSPVFSFPWAGGYRSYPANFTVPAPPTDTASLYAKPGASVADDDAKYAQGAISFQRRPTLIRFKDHATVWLQYLRTVSPSSKGTVFLGFSRARAAGELSALVRQAETAVSLPSCRVPDVVRRTLTRARAALARAHCTLGKVTRRKSRTVKRNVVTRQGPGPGTILPYHGKVNLRVSSGAYP